MDEENVVNMEEENEPIRLQSNIGNSTLIYEISKEKPEYDYGKLTLLYVKEKEEEEEEEESRVVQLINPYSEDYKVDSIEKYLNLKDVASSVSFVQKAIDGTLEYLSNQLSEELGNVLDGYFTIGRHGMDENGVMVEGAERFNDYRNNKALGVYSHVEGFNNKALGNASHAGGMGTIASGAYQFACGRYNIEDINKYVFIIGNGIDNDNRHNGFAIDWNGHVYLGGSLDTASPLRASRIFGKNNHSLQFINMADSTKTGAQTSEGGAAIEFKRMTYDSEGNLVKDIVLGFWDFEKISQTEGLVTLFPSRERNGGQEQSLNPPLTNLGSDDERWNTIYCKGAKINNWEIKDKLITQRYNTALQSNRQFQLTMQANPGSKDEYSCFQLKSVNKDDPNDIEYLFSVSHKGYVYTKGITLQGKNINQVGALQGSSGNPLNLSLVDKDSNIFGQLELSYKESTGGPGRFILQKGKDTEYKYLMQLGTSENPWEYIYVNKITALDRIILNGPLETKNITPLDSDDSYSGTYDNPWTRIYSKWIVAKQYIEVWGNVFIKNRDDDIGGVLSGILSADRKIHAPEIIAENRLETTAGFIPYLEGSTITRKKADGTDETLECLYIGGKGLTKEIRISFHGGEDVTEENRPQIYLYGINFNYADMSKLHTLSRSLINKGINPSKIQVDTNGFLKISQ